jgi:predicted TIM-barrel fold metal-dependent hydrolase
VNIIDLGEQRIKDMNEGRVSLQLISHIPAVEKLETCRKANNQLTAAVAAHPTRFAGFAFLPMADPSGAATELERCIKELGFIDTPIPNQAAGIYYDGEAYYPFWERAQELDVPVYLHPAPPSATQGEHFKGNYPDEITQVLPTRLGMARRRCFASLLPLRLWPI